MTPDQWAAFWASVVLILGFLGGIWVKWWRPFIKAAKHDVVSGRDALLGRPEVRDTVTGKVLAPALPGMGIRMDTNEQQMAVVVDAVAQIAPALAKIADTQKWQEDAGQEIAKLRTQQTEHQKQITENARDIAELRHGYVERIMSRADSEAAFRAIEAVATNGDVESTPDRRNP